MKKLMALLLALLCLFGSAMSESPATPTDIEELVEIEDDDWGNIDIKFERQVYIDVPLSPVSIGENVVFTAILVNFKENDIIKFEWQYTTDLESWSVIEGANKQTYDFILTEENYNYWYRVLVKVEELA